MIEVGIIGLGKIASGYGSVDDPAPYTHAGGILHSEKVSLVAVADFSEEARGQFKEKWGRYFPETRAHDSLEGFLEGGVPDIVSICIRGPHHYGVLLRVIEAGPRAIFLEKPPTCSLEEMDGLRDAARLAGIPITVSYSRHWGPHVLRMADLVREGLVGEVQRVTGYCGNAFLSFASHTTDMICQFAGYDPVAVYARGRVPEASVPENYELEPHLETMLIEFESGRVGSQLASQGAEGWFTCEVEGSDGRVRVPFYGKPVAWNKDGEELELTGFPPNASPFTLAYDQIAQHLNGGPIPDCTDADFHAVHEVGFAGIESALTDRRVALPNTNRQRRVFANG